MKVIDDLLTGKRKSVKVTAELSRWPDVAMCDCCKKPHGPLLEIQVAVRAKSVILIWLCKRCIKLLTYG